MIKKFFLTERKGYLVLCIAGLVLCLIAALGFSFAGIGATDAVRARLAEKAFASFTLISYIIPLAVLLMSFFTYRKCYRTAGADRSPSGSDGAPLRIGRRRRTDGAFRTACTRS